MKDKREVDGDNRMPHESQSVDILLRPCFSKRSPNLCCDCIALWLVVKVDGRIVILRRHEGHEIFKKN